MGLFILPEYNTSMRICSAFIFTSPDIIIVWLSHKHMALSYYFKKFLETILWLY